MKTSAALVTLLAAAVAQAHDFNHHRSERGLMDQAEKLWDRLNDGIGNLHTTVHRDLASRLRPWADRVEAEVSPAVRQAQDGIETAFHAMSNSPLFGSALDRNGEDEDDGGAPRPGLVGSLFSDHYGQSPMLDPFNLFGLQSPRRRWWDGRNVCVDRKVIDESEDNKEEEKEEEESGGVGIAHFMDMTMTTCRDGDNFHECTTHVNTNGRRKTVIVKHHCCFGYARSSGGSSQGCTQIEMRSMPETINDLEGEEFMRMVASVGLEEELLLSADKNVTVFVPSDDAVEDLRRDLEEMNAVERISYNIDDGLTRRRKRNSELTVVETPRMSDIVRNHVVDGLIDASHLKDEDLLQTKNPDGKLRVTVYRSYPDKVIMANCARVVSRDHYSEGGVAHVVDRVIMPATRTLAEIVASDEQFSTLAEALEEAGLMEDLAKEGQFTLFAPTNAAFENLDEAMKEKILSGNGCSQDILNNHMLPNVICSGVIETRAKTVNALNKHVVLERNAEDELIVEGVRVGKRDIVGTNGVLHVVEEVMLPESARSVDAALEESGAETLRELFTLSGISESLDASANMTVFAPSEKALQALPKEYLDDLKSDKNKLKEFLMYHVATPKTCHCEFEHNMLLPSGLDGKKLRVNMYNSAPLGLLDVLPRQTPTVQCARVLSADAEVCGGMVHTVDKVLLPPAGDVVEIMRARGKFSKFVELVAFAELEAELSGEGPFTVLAPTDEAFDHLADSELAARAFEDKEVAARLVQHHVLRDAVCCAGIPRQMPFFDVSGRRAEDGDVVSLRKSGGGHIYAGRSEVTTCDMVAENGVVHGLDRVMVPVDLQDRDEREKEIAERERVEQSRNDNPFLIFKLFK